MVSSEGDILGPFRGAGCNPLDRHDWEAVLANLFALSGADRYELAHAVLGLAGYGETVAVDAAQERFATRLDCPTTLVNDVAVAFHGAFAGGAGVLVLAGTGSMAWAGDGSGRSLRVGGFGPDLGDEGSAHWVGMRALQLLSWQLDGRAQDDGFKEGMSVQVPVSSSRELIAWLHAPGHRRSRVARLARRVDELAANGNANARELLEAAADELARLAVAADRRLGLAAPCPISFAGGLFGSDLLKAALLERLGQRFVPCAAELDPLGGALLMAADRAGWQVTSTWCKKLRQGMATVRPIKKRLGA